MVATSVRIRLSSSRFFQTIPGNNNNGDDGDGDGDYDGSGDDEDSTTMILPLKNKQQPFKFNAFWIGETKLDGKDDS